MSKSWSAIDLSSKCFRHPSIYDLQRESNTQTQTCMHTNVHTNICTSTQTCTKHHKIYKDTSFISNATLVNAEFSFINPVNRSKTFDRRVVDVLLSCMIAINGII